MALLMLLINFQFHLDVRRTQNPENRDFLVHRIQMTHGYLVLRSKKPEKRPHDFLTQMPDNRDSQLQFRLQDSCRQPNDLPCQCETQVQACSHCKGRYEWENRQENGFEQYLSSFHRQQYDP